MRKEIWFLPAILTTLLSFCLSFCQGQWPPSVSYDMPSRLVAGNPVSFFPTTTGVSLLVEPYVNAVAGSATPSSTGVTGNALDMEFSFFSSMVSAPDGSLYFCDALYSGIRRLSPSGQVTIFVAGGSSLGDPSDMVMDSEGNIFFCDRYRHVIRRVTPGGVITLIAGAQGVSGYADGTGGAARFSSPSGIAIDTADNLYVIDHGNKRIRKVTSAGAVTTLAGNGSSGVVNGPGSSASFRDLGGIDTDSQGNVYVSEYADHVIRKIAPSGQVSTYAGVAGSGSDQDGTGTNARFYNPGKLSIDKTKDDIYVAQSNTRIRKITSSLEISTVIGYGNWGQREGFAADIWYEYVDALLWGSDGALYIGNSDGDAFGYLHKYREDPFSIVPALPKGMTFNRTSGEIGGSPKGLSPLSSYEVTAYGHGTIQYSTELSFSVELPIPWISYDIPERLTRGETVSFSPTNTGGPVHSPGYIRAVGGSRSPTVYDLEGNALDMHFGYVYAMVYDPGGDIYFFDNMYNGIRKISPLGQVSLFVGGAATGGVIDGIGGAASFNNLKGMAMDSQGNIYTCEYTRHLIRKITPAGVVTTLAGLLNTAGYADGSGGAARFSYPSGITVDHNDNLYIIDSGNKRIRKMTPTGVVTTLAGNGSSGIVDGPGASASFRNPSGIATDSQDNIYVSEPTDNIIRKITPSGMVSTYIGVAGSSSHVDGTGSSARFFYPTYLAIDKAKDDIYVTQGNGRIRKISSSLEVTTISGGGNIIGEDGPALDISHEDLQGITWGENGGLLISDMYYDEIGCLRRYEEIGGYSIIPALPVGLEMDVDGTISGTPSEPSPLTTYEVTASNQYGQHSTLVSFSVSNEANGSAAQDMINRDKHLNWNISQVFDEEGNVIGESKTFYLHTGRELQTQVRNKAANKILASQELYDAYGRNAIATLAAPIDSSLFSYHSGFIKGPDGTYNYTHFDGSKVRSPDAVTLNERGSLGWYYSNNNTLDTYQATTGYPYARTTYYADGSGIKESFGVGDEMRSGKGRSIRSNTTGVGQELQHYIAVYNRFIVPYLNQNASVPSQTLTHIHATQTVHTDVDGRQYISISDASGRVLMTARADDNGILSMASTRQVPVPEDGASNVVYFNILQSGSAVSATGNYQLVDMDSEQTIPMFSTGVKGYYKLTALQGAASISYTNKVSDISYVFYNDIGQPIISIDPMGVEKLIQQGLEAYTAIAQVPFVTISEYDLRGRVVATVSAETGRTEYIYRNDNAIRFSQNAEQRKTGALSYTNYDANDRLIEGGVYSGMLSFSG
ncbi:hypothetical protein FXV77_10665, partial [Sphingobacterium phlebotomi]